ncbi:acyl-CoA dehydrogenase family protein [Variovorax sp. LG9.2]|jgi:alkylation response protein AidB-like acyl-CoA dehydrogenase|uniref:acyl-CoA dehydrogenase family protein n=1 Tax=Variovorax sp. LG9.2 TaxID=3048626 RepID=UPI002B23BDFA|nr:acyl-CoA dehydrogenase family protein [Variovorax sp. LG9.2]MEB0055730.1 acyl-CoA dehydrogenase family protein [Variovorax sp. LG9.2]
MSTFDTPELRAFRAEVRDFLQHNLTPDLVLATRGGLHMEREPMARWQKALNARGWGGPHWPKALGGTGWTELQRYIFEEESAFADAPLGDVHGLFLAGPMIIAAGSAAQQARYLPKVLAGEEFWCQGFSETNAGSDLASLKTTARLEGDEWVINGHKTWLSSGHHADLMFCLARTDSEVKPQAGLTQFIIDMRSPGISLQPILTMDEGHSVNAVFFDNVRTHRDNVIGELNHGWTYAKELLARERVNNAQGPRTKRDIVELDRMARTRLGVDGKPLIEDPLVRRRLAILTADFVALESAALGVLAQQMAGNEPGPAASTLKIRGSELQQRVSETAMSLLGQSGVVLAPEYGGGLLAPDATGWAERHFFRRVVTIYAGANEIQKTIIAKSILDM